MIDRLINTGVSYDTSTSHSSTDEITQHEIVINPKESADAANHHDEEQNDDDGTKEAEETEGEMMLMLI